jgi:hypothetical protein
MTPDPAIATAADYADALMTARRAKNLLVLLLVLLLLIQIAIFFIAKYTNLIVDRSATVALTPSTAPAGSARWTDVLLYLSGLSVFLGVTLAIVLAMVLFLLVKIMLVGRLIGVARLTSAYIISLLVLVLLFPWQAFLSNATFSDPSFKVPGVLWTWNELMLSAKLGVGPERADVAPTILHWARFVVFPLVTVILLLMIQVKSNRGLRQALGEDAMIDVGADVPAS